MWWSLAAAAAPYVMSMFQDKPQMPGAPAPIQLPDRSGYASKLLDSAYNPNSATYMLASKSVMDNVSRELARRGLSGSSVGNQILASTQSDLANKWLDQVVQREQGALDTVNNLDRTKAGLDLNQQKQQYDYGMNAYNDAVNRNASQVQGLSGLVNAGMNIYNRQQMMDRLDQLTKQGAPTYAFYGVPGSTSSNLTMPQIGSSYAPSSNYNLGG